ncbi:MAG: D-alanyl-D-alanine carboxypeptidase [Alphaproteobacteria bacterium]|nr:D-alanyl-D-alanine carboxypeptidase [Alphaproteobacteria bacterium]
MRFSTLLVSRPLQIGIAILAFASVNGTLDAQAKTKAQAAAPYAPPYSELVVDARSGKTLYAVAPDAQRHPASITKVMTLYLLFEELDAGRLNLGSQIKISQWAQKQAPSKLGLNAGDTISVEDAIKAVVTKSANDIAIAIAEQIGGTESNFADLMTKKAKALGMTRTVYANASGLPNPRQLTTARDLVTLGKSLQQRFPRYYAYFSLRSFDYEGDTIANHNKLLGRVDGVDGIKTGYTQASGFNLLTSVHQDDHALLAVILGGRSGPARDRRMAELIDTYIDNASGVDGKKKVAANAAPISQGDTEAVTAPVTPKVTAKAPDAPASTLSARVEQNWWIQVGVAKSEKQAQSVLAEIRKSKDVLSADAVAAAEKVNVGGKEMWRSRFTKLSEMDAAAACTKLKKRGIACFASRS